MRRLAGFSYTGRYRYSVTICVSPRRPALGTRATVTPLLRILCDAARAEQFAILAYCVMPDHVHLVLEGQREDSSLRRFVWRFKRDTGFWFARSNGESLWQEGYHERVLRDDETTRDVVRYVLDNPVRAGVVQRPEEWPYSAAPGLAIDDWL